MARSLALVVPLLVLFSALAGHVPTDSDKATVLLEGQAVRQGHFLLHGWTLTRDSYWTLDVPLLAVGVLVAGLRSWLARADTVVMAVAVLAAGAWIAASAAAGRAAKWAGAAVVVVLLAFPTSATARFFLGDGFHVGTVLCALVAFVALAEGTFGRRWVAGVLLLVVGMLGDLLIVPYAVVPVALAGLAAMARRRSWRAGVPQVAAAAAGVVAGLLAGLAVRAAGGFAIGPYLSVQTGRLFTNVRLLFGYGADLVGLLDREGTGGVPLPLHLVHVVGALVLLATTAVAVWRLGAAVATGRRPADDRPEQEGTALPESSMDDSLLFAALGAGATFVVLGTGGFASARFLVLALLFAGVLAGRVVARCWPVIGRGRAGRVVATAGVSVSLGYAACTGYLLAARAPVQPQQALASWLYAHGLRLGIGDYWSSSATTVASGGQVVVRPVATLGSGMLARRTELSAASWYVGQHFEFLVFESRPVWDGVDIASATRTFGPPAHMYVVGTYRILVWAHDVAVATR